jgi:hypothetical protein
MTTRDKRRSEGDISWKSGIVEVIEGNRPQKIEGTRNQEATNSISTSSFIS